MHCRERIGSHGLFVLILLILFNSTGIIPLVAQEQPELTSVSEDTQLTEANQLLRETIYLDITTADYYELQNWLRRIGLESSGTRASLENRLLTYYRGIFSTLPLTTMDGNSESDSGLSTMEIESAGELRYEQSDVDGELVRLSGGVILYMRDAENDTLHTVEAQSLVLNRTQNTVSAVGNVHYRMEKGDTTQDFHGQEISFDIENYRGVFIQGMSTRPTNIEEEVITFYFKGTNIYRIQRDVLRLEEGLISSSRLEDPYYHISAGNVWILGIEEWALRDAVFYIGHIPLLYIPFFYHPGDTFVFHPSIGVRSLEGYYTQTTTYFFGRKPETGDDSSRISFLQAVEGDRSGYSQELDGFFLRNTREPRPQNWITRTDSFGKLQVDYYTRLGLLTAVKLDMQDLGSIKNLDLMLGAGFTNYIYYLPGYSSTYTAMQYNGDSDSYRKNFQHPYVLGKEYPFRFGFDLDLEIQHNSFGFKLKLPFYSDLLLHDQLSNRNESLDWGRFFMGKGESGEISFEEYDNPEFLQSIALHMGFLEDLRWIDTFSVDQLDTKIRLDQSELEEDDQSLNPLGYYYPDLFTLVDLEMSIRGTILQSNRATEGEKETAVQDEKKKQVINPNFKAPVERSDGPADEGMAEDMENVYKIPDEGGDIPMEKKEVSAPFSHTLRYIITPDFSYHTQYDTEIMGNKNPEAIELDPLYSYIYTDGNTVIDYDAAMFQNRFHFSQTARMKGRYRDHFDGEDLEGLIERDRELSYFEVSGLTTLTNYLWRGHPNLEDSYIEYEIESDLYTLAYNESGQYFESILPSWNEESIQNHRSSFGLVYDGWNQSQKFRITYTMPPRLQEINLLLDLKTGPLESAVEYDLQEAESGEWEKGPLDIRETLSLFNQSSVSQEFTVQDPDESTADSATTLLKINLIPEKVTAYQKLEWNLSADRPELSISSLRTGWWTNQFEMLYTANYRFSEMSGWNSTGTSEFQLYRFSSQLKIPYEPDLFWKNRIELSSSLNATLQFNLIRYNESLFQFSWDTKFSIAEFVDLKLSIDSANNSIYRYIPAYSEAIGKEPLNLFDDLLKSFNFFRTDDRIASNFNLQSISFSLIHYMHDWQLNMQYSGKPRLNDDNLYKWRSEFSIFVQWNPIPEIRKEATYDEDGLEI